MAKEAHNKRWRQFLVTGKGFRFSKILFGFLVLLLAISALALYLPNRAKSGSFGNVTLFGGPFVDPDAEDTHRASQWQVAWCTADPVFVNFDSGTDLANLTSVTVSSDHFTDGWRYYFRYRYQDNHYRWSDWTDWDMFGYPTDPGVCALTPTPTPGESGTEEPSATTTTTVIDSVTVTITVTETPTETATTTTTVTTTMSGSATVTVTITVTPSSTGTVCQYYCDLNGDGVANECCDSPQGVHIIKPNGGETWCLSQKYPIEWDSGGSPVDIDLSLDGGASWVGLRNSADNPKKLFGGWTTKYDYTIPNSPFFLSNNAKARIKNCGTLSCSVYDQSDSSFTISDCSGQGGGFNLQDLNVFIWPESTTLRPDWGQSFAARVLLKDLTDVTKSSNLVWSLMAGNLGLIDQTGYFTAGQTEGSWKNLVNADAAYNGMSAEDFADVTIDKNYNPSDRGGFIPLHDYLLRLIGVNADSLLGENGLLKGFFNEGSPLDTATKVLLTLLGALQMISYIMLPKRRPLWGMVYDSLSKKPISGAVLSLADEAGKIRDRQRTNQEGVFGFLAPAGKYSISIYRENYSFPARFVKGRVDGRFENLYFGGVFKTQAESLSTTERAPVYLNIPLDKSKLKMPRDLLPLIYNSLRYFISIVRMPILILGTVLAGYLVARNHTIINILILALYVIIWVIEIKNTLKPNRFGTIEDKHGNPLGLAVVRAIDQSGKVKGTTTTLPDGKFNLNLSPGVYNFSIVKNGYKKSDLKNVKISRLDDFGKILIRLDKA